MTVDLGHSGPTTPVPPPADQGSVSPLRHASAIGQPADLLGALAFLVSDESAFVTGQTLLVNGGRLSL